MPEAPGLSSLQPCQFEGLNPDINDVCTIEVTVPTGLEDVCAEEVQEKLACNPVKILGRTFFDIRTDEVSKVLSLRSVENVQVVIHIETSFPFTSIREECFEKLYHLVEKPAWKKGLLVWQKIFGELQYDPFVNECELVEKFQAPNPVLDLKLLKSESPVAKNLPDDIRKLCKNLNKKKQGSDESPTAQATEEQKTKDGECSDSVTTSPEANVQSTDAAEDGLNKAQKSSEAEHAPRFRVSCCRSGENHVFGSQEAARQLGASINEKFKWPVDLKNFLIEIMLNISSNVVYTSLALTRTALYKRNLVSFGPTNLRSTLAYSLVHLTKPQLGDIVLDHMCGGASIPIEGSLSFPCTYHIGGDIHPKAIQRARENVDNLVQNSNKSLKTDVCLWDATRLPLRDASVDIVVSDLPFGKRCGSKFDNRVLYLKALEETARVTRASVGRAVLLTYDRNSMTKNLVKVKHLWKNSSCRTVNIGGLSAAVFILHRTLAGVSTSKTANKTGDDNITN